MSICRLASLLTKKTDPDVGVISSDAETPVWRKIKMTAFRCQCLGPGVYFQ